MSRTRKLLHANRDGRINAVDLKAYGVASDIAVVPFRISD
jgi:hypothetical protein